MGSFLALLAFSIAAAACAFWRVWVNSGGCVGHCSVPSAHAERSGVEPSDLAQSLETSSLAISIVSPLAPRAGFSPVPLWGLLSCRVAPPRQPRFFLGWRFSPVKYVRSHITRCRNTDMGPRQNATTQLSFEGPRGPSDR